MGYEKWYGKHEAFCLDHKPDWAIYAKYKQYQYSRPAKVADPEPALPAHWIDAEDEGGLYYFNIRTGITTRTKPELKKRQSVAGARPAAAKPGRQRVKEDCAMTAVAKQRPRANTWPMTNKVRRKKRKDHFRTRNAKPLG